MSKVINTVGGGGSGGGSDWVLAWQNTDPTSNQAAQTVNVDLSPYKQLLFIFNRNPSNVDVMNLVWNAFFDFNTMSGAAVTAVTAVDGNGKLGRRIIDTISSTGFNIQKGVKFNTYGTPSDDNSILILQYVYGR